MGFTFLRPIDALFALAAVVPLAALWLAHARMERVRRLFSLTTPRRRELAGVVAALALLPVLMGVAAPSPSSYDTTYWDRGWTCRCFSSSTPPPR